MNKLKAAIITCLLISQTGWAMNINSSLSGSWYNPLQNGHGLSVEVVDATTTVIYWYVYNPDGTPTFLLTVAQNDGSSASGDTFIQSGMKFGEFDPNDLIQEFWGTVTLTFQGCDTAELVYSSNDPGFGSGSIPMSRLASIGGLKCKDTPMHGNYSIGNLEFGANGTEITTGTAVLFANGDLTYTLGTDVATQVGQGAWSTAGEEDSKAIELSATVYPTNGVGGAMQVSSSGFYNEDGFRTGFFPEGMTATLLHSFQNGLTLQMLTGTYRVADTNVVIGEAIIATDGTITGNIDDCQLRGSIHIPDSNFNQGVFDIDLQDCDASGKVVGAVIYRHDFGSMKLMGNDATKGIVWSFN